MQAVIGDIWPSTMGHSKEYYMERGCFVDRIRVKFYFRYTLPIESIPYLAHGIIGVNTESFPY